MHDVCMCGIKCVSMDGHELCVTVGMCVLWCGYMNTVFHRCMWRPDDRWQRKSIFSCYQRVLGIHSGCQACTADTSTCYFTSPKWLLLTLSTSTCRKELKQRRAIIKEFTVPMLKVYEWGPEMGWCDGKGTSQPPSWRPEFSFLDLRGRKRTNSRKLSFDFCMLRCECVCMHNESINVKKK